MNSTKALWQTLHRFSFLVSVYFKVIVASTEFLATAGTEAGAKAWPCAHYYHLFIHLSVFCVA